MKPNSILVVSNETKLNIKDSIKLDITLESNICGINLISYIDNFIEKAIRNNNEIEWLIYNLNLDDNNIEDMIIINSYLPYYLYNKYSNLKFIFNSSGEVFGEREWNKTELEVHTPISTYAKTQSLRELKGDRSWVLRYDIFDESLLNMNFVKDKVYYGHIDKKFSYITYKSLNKVIEGLIINHTEIKPDTYHIIPKDTHTQFEILNYVSWKKNTKSYIERSSSIESTNRFLKSKNISILNNLWKFAGYSEIPTFKNLFDEL